MLLPLLIAVSFPGLGVDIFGFHCWLNVFLSSFPQFSVGLGQTRYASGKTCRSSCSERACQLLPVRAHRSQTPFIIATIGSANAKWTTKTAGMMSGGWPGADRRTSDADRRCRARSRANSRVASRSISARSR
jgi:hypothetical protein